MVLFRYSLNKINKLIVIPINNKTFIIMSAILIHSVKNIGYLFSMMFISILSILLSIVAIQLFTFSLILSVIVLGTSALTWYCFCDMFSDFVDDSKEYKVAK